jgi:hypothetical protein
MRNQAIMVSPCAQGWRWELVDGDGATTLTGFCDEQFAAMDSAWRAAKRSADLPSLDYPQIVVRHESAQA